MFSVSEPTVIWISCGIVIWIYTYRETWFQRVGDVANMAVAVRLSAISLQHLSFIISASKFIISQFLKLSQRLLIPEESMVVDGFHQFPPPNWNSCAIILIFPQVLVYLFDESVPPFYSFYTVAYAWQAMAASILLVAWWDQSSFCDLFYVLEKDDDNTVYIGRDVFIIII